MRQLEAASIPAVIADEHIIAMDWRLAYAVGGIKLRVRSTDVAEAREIMAAAREAALGRGYAEKPEPCSRCGSTNTRRLTFKRPAFVTWLLLGTPMFPVLRRLRCLGSTKGRLDACCFAIAFVLASSAAVTAQDPSAPAATSPIPGYRTEKRVLTSEALGEPRPYFVGLPESYSHDSARRYPVIYVLDGLSQGLPLAAAAAQMSRDKLMPELIVVAIPNVSGV